MPDILCLGKIPLTIASSLVQSDRIVYLPTLTMVDYAQISSICNVVGTWEELFIF